MKPIVWVFVAAVIFCSFMLEIQSHFMALNKRIETIEMAITQLNMKLP